VNVSRSPLRVLLVEDNPGDAHLIETLLDQHSPGDFNIRHVSRLDQALTDLADDPADIVLLDLSLPDASGLDGFGKLWADRAEVPVIVLTGLDDDSLAAEAVRGGAQDYLVKGQVDGGQLARCIRYAIERNASMAKLRRWLSAEQQRSEHSLSGDDMKNVFLAAVAHDLRAPLWSIRELADILRRDLEVTPPAQARQMLEWVAADARRLEALLGALFDLDRLSHGAEGPAWQLTDVRALVEHSVRQLQLGVRVDVEIPALAAEVDAALLERIVQNLVLNSAGRAPTGTPVAVRVHGGPRELVLAVDDEGAPPPESFDHVVAPDHALLPGDHTQPGFGVALQLVARLARLHHGRLWVEGRPGGGVSFRVLLSTAPTGREVL
jgi:sigma-B regulation protein RsbU (phosphoserine phosphatase)